MVWVTNAGGGFGAALAVGYLGNPALKKKLLNCLFDFFLPDSFFLGGICEARGACGSFGTRKQFCSQGIFNC